MSEGPADTSSIHSRLPELLRDPPDAAAALRLAEGVVESALERDLLPATLDAETEARLGQILRATCGVAPFLGPMLRRHPDWLRDLLADDLTKPSSQDELAARISKLVPNAPESDAAAALRHFKYREFARITVRDCDADLVPLEHSETTLREISQLADVLLARALDVAATTVADSCGPPVWETAAGEPVELGFCVLGLGKLGGEELNYSSDVDLIYIYETPPEDLRVPAGDESGRAKRPPAEWFTRLAQAFGRVVTEQTADGFLYRVDLDLRPEGAQGVLVVHADALSRYYEAWADTWEKAAFMKARPVAGDLDLGWRAIREVAPMIYRSAMDYETLEGIRTLKSRVSEARAKKHQGFNVKIDRGGIRDVEFACQALQLLHGARIPQTRVRSTLSALDALSDVGLLDASRAQHLRFAYLFLRRTENRLQMAAERQTHVVPTDDAPRTRLARAMDFEGDDALADFDEELAAHRAEVAERGEEGYSADTLEHITELFERNAAPLLQLPATREMIERLASDIAAVIDASPDRMLALNNLDRFITRVGSRRFYYELLMDRPEVAERLTNLFAVSKYLSSFVASHPDLIEPLFDDPNRLLLGPDELAADLGIVETACTNGRDDDEEGLLDALRLFHHRQIVNVGLLDVDGRIDRAQAERALTDIAAVCLGRGLALAEVRAARRRDGVPAAARDGSYLVVAAGKFGSYELSYGSDLDLFFIYDVGAADGAAALEAQSWYVTLTQRLISALQTTTTEGSCYEIDTRLRPSGNQGMLVTSLAALRRYHDAGAELWERQALLRARGVAGSDDLMAAFDALRLEVLNRPLPDAPRRRIHEIRQRMETELAKETSERRNFKTGRGGLLDVETIVQFLSLAHGPAHPELFEVAPIDDQLLALERLELLQPKHAVALRTGWNFLQQLASRLRIVENRSISDLDSERGDLDGLARRLGYTESSREGSARRALLNEYGRCTDSIRAVYDEIMRPEAEPSTEPGTGAAG